VVRRRAAPYRDPLSVTAAPFLARLQRAVAAHQAQAAYRIDLDVAERRMRVGRGQGGIVPLNPGRRLQCVAESQCWRDGDPALLRGRSRR
jgi:hypothetical protein